MLNSINMDVAGENIEPRLFPTRRVEEEPFVLTPGLNFCFLDLGSIPASADLGKRKFEEDEFRRFLEEKGTDKNQEAYYKWKEEVVRQGGDVSAVFSVVLPANEENPKPRSILFALAQK